MTKKTIDPKLKALFDHMPGAWGCKDLNSVFIYANAEYTQMFGLAHPDDIVGKTDYDMPCETVNCAELFREQDKKVIKTGRRVRVLDIHPFANGEWKAYIFTKTPLFDESHNIVGTIFYGQGITDAASVELGAFLSNLSPENIKNNSLKQGNITLKRELNKPKVSERQFEVLYYLLRGKTVKQIANILSISSRTIDEHLEQLRAKFNVTNKYQLISKAISCGFLNVIPDRLLKIQLSVELME